MAEDLSIPVPQTPKQNWALWAGVVLIVLIIGLAFIGPLLAPQDPLQENYIGRIGTRFKPPPFPPGQVEGFPLGSDQFGRDVFSRLLYAIRPTMTLVIVVATLRLFFGIWIGLVSGWWKGRLGQVLDTLTAGVIAIPVLFVALCVVAALSNKWGVWAFILGLSITGWAETARLIHEQTRAVKAQPFIEAARAMGAESGQLLLSYVIPHILPLMWIQLAFEVSASLLAVAALGFLGYFVNAVWIPVGEFTGLRASGAPELGQMLGDSVHGVSWVGFYAGTLVFLIVLAFNLFGEGLRAELSPERRRTKRTDQVVERAGAWVEERVYLFATEWRRTATTSGAFALLFLVMLGGTWTLWQAQHNTMPETKLSVPGNQLWAAEQRDAQGSYWAAVSGPEKPDLAWLYTAPEGFVGGPVVDADGNLYLNASNGFLLSLDSSGKERWRLKFPLGLVGSPAVSSEGEIVVADEKGGLSKVDNAGNLLWTYLSDPADQVGELSPVVGPTGLIYYTVRDYIVAVTPDGKRFWQIYIPTYSYTTPLPRLSADGLYMFFEDFIIEADTGQTLFKATPEPTDRYVVGADGHSYLRTSDSLKEWQITESGAALVDQAVLDTRTLGTSFRFPYDLGVAPSHSVWLLYSSGFEYLRLVWTDPKGHSPLLIDYPFMPGRLIGIDRKTVVYVCGILRHSPPECRANRLDTGAALWKFEIKAGGFPVGGAIVDQRLYVTMREGYLYAIGP